MRISLTGEGIIFDADMSSGSEFVFIRIGITGIYGLIWTITGSGRK